MALGVLSVDRSVNIAARHPHLGCKVVKLLMLKPLGIVSCSTGDLLCCGQIANNYLENNSKVPWDDLRYMFGEIMYGGHIVEDWDRRLANAYLHK